MGHTQIVGSIGEDVAAAFLVKRGYEIVDRNYRKKCGEIDIVARLGKVLHFVEVKSVSCETLPSGIVGQNGRKRPFAPIDRVNYHKIKRLSRIIEYYLLAKRVSFGTLFQFDVASVYISRGDGASEVEILEDVRLG